MIESGVERIHSKQAKNYTLQIFLNPQTQITITGYGGHQVDFLLKKLKYCQQFVILFIHFEFAC